MSQSTPPTCKGDASINPAVRVCTVIALGTSPHVEDETQARRHTPDMSRGVGCCWPRPDGGQPSSSVRSRSAHLRSEGEGSERPGTASYCRGDEAWPWRMSIRPLHAECARGRTTDHGWARQATEEEGTGWTARRVAPASYYILIYSFGSPIRLLRSSDVDPIELMQRSAAHISLLPSTVVRKVWHREDACLGRRRLSQLWDV